MGEESGERVVVRIEGVEGGRGLAAARELLAEYFAQLGLGGGVEAQHAAEVAGLPGEYAPSMGRLFLARAGREVAGCVALRRLEERAGEIKRLYVRRAFRGTGLGRALAVAAIEAAREIGYERVRLDTLPSMAAAIALYRGLGFREIPPYRQIDLPNLLVLELELLRIEPGPGPASQAERQGRIGNAR
jgi:ribosomal protein S18 acetylase RimI-like enzyme